MDLGGLRGSTELLLAGQGTLLKHQAEHKRAKQRGTAQVQVLCATFIVSGESI